MLVHIKKLIQQAKKEKYALGAFDTFNLETTLGITEGAKQAKRPIILQVTPTTIKYAGIESISHLIRTVVRNQAENIPIALHLDHGKTFSDVVECIKAGFSSVMIDASNLPFNKNIVLTKKVVQYAHQHNIWVQGELGKVFKGKQGYDRLINRPEDFLTDPDQAQEFVKKTKIHTLAVAIGNIHGPYKLKHGVPRLFLSRLKEIQKKVNVPLVLHGASGISSAQIKKAISLGVRIVNIDTEIRMAFKQGLTQSLKANKKEYDPRKILFPTIKNVEKIVKKKILIFSLSKK